MKILHWAIILVIIVLPTSLICRINVNAKFSALKDEVRINNAIDTATKDAIDQLISVNEVINFNGEFGDVIDVTPELAQEMVDTFFHTMAVNYNIPYQYKDFNGASNQSYIKNYFSPYIPAIVIVAYDGFYVYSLEQSGSGYKYEMSAKIPYACDYTVTKGARTYNYSIGYTLGNDIYLYYDGKCYSGRLTDNSKNSTALKFTGADGYNSTGLTGTDLVDYIYSISNDMSSIIYALSTEYSALGGVPFDENILPASGVTNFLQDYTFNVDGSISGDAGQFQKKKKEVIINIISACLNQEINDHKSFANISGITYEFKFPTISQQDWINTIDDISVLAFVQGIPIGNAEGTYYNNFALGGSKIVKSGYVYITQEGSKLYYHNSKCNLLPKDANGDVDYLDNRIKYMVKSKKEAALPQSEGGYGAYPCLKCN